MKVYNEVIRFSTRGEVEFTDLTGKVEGAVKRSNIKNGLVHVFAPHATGVLILTENEHGLLLDIRDMLERLMPKSGRYRHPLNAHSHIRSAFLAPDKTLPVIDGRLALGTWQSLLFIETDVHPRERTLIVQVIGE